MIDLRLTLIRAQLEGALRRAPREVTREMAGAFRVIGSRFVRFMTKERLRKSGVPTTGDPRPGLFRRTGGLARSLNRKVDGAGRINDLKLTVGWLDPRSASIAGVHEFGATIRPKSSQYLTIPLPAAQTPAGVLRQPARSYTNAFVFRSKAGNLILARKSGKGIEPLFVLKREITIPPRLEFQKSWDSERFRRQRLSVISDAINSGLEKAGF